MRSSAWPALLATVGAAIVLPVLSASPALAAPGGCRSPADPGQVVTQLSWHQRWLTPERIWPITDGAGVRVAVIDSGVDDDHPQLAGRVTAGTDVLGIERAGNVDCAAHGTAVASVIAATARDGIGFRGLAPGVTIVPLRVVERLQGSDGDAASAGDRLATAIDLAVDAGVDVINMSLTMYRPDDAVRAAIERARKADIVLVAAAGNEHQRGERPDPTPYPAAFDGVIGVGAIDENGLRVPDSQVGEYVDLVAPGGGMVVASRVSGHAVVSGTSYATPVVSAAAALLRAAEPDLTAEEVTRRLIATADPAAGERSSGYGHGVVNPYRAVTEALTRGEPVAAPGLPGIAEDPQAAARTARWRLLGQVAVATVAGTALLAAGFAVTVVALPRGRRQGWRPTRAADGTAGAAGVPPPETDPQETFFVVPGIPR